MILQARFDEALRLLHVTYLVSIEESMKESCFDIDLVDFPVKCRPKVRKDTKRLHVGSRCGSLRVILAPDSRITLTDIACLKACGITIMVSFELENRTTTHDLTTRRNRGTRDKLIHTKIPKRRELLLKGRGPLGRMRGRHGLTVGRRIVRQLVGEVIGHGSKEIDKAGELVVGKRGRKEVRDVRRRGRW
jgi:hypothetical protein